MAAKKYPTPGSSLGLKTTNDVAINEKILDGFSVASLKRFERESAIPGDVILDVIDLPARTLARRKAAGKLHADESERLFRLARVFELATALFEGDRAGAVQWLQSPARAFAGQTPLSMARTEFGARQVENLIGRLEHGVFT